MSWIQNCFLKNRYPTEIRHSMSETEFRQLVAGQKVELRINKRIFPDAPKVTLALQDIGWDLLVDAVMDAMLRGQIKREATAEADDILRSKRESERS